MGEMGDGYGSEFHLLRYLGRHRRVLDAAVLHETKAESVDWIDFDFDPSSAFGDRELSAINFLSTSSPARQRWPSFWPTKGGTMNWDAVGVLQNAGSREWLLVEAKGNVEELSSSCQASESGGQPLIATSLDAAKRDLGVEASKDWLNGHYQHANRLAALHFLNANGEPARLLFLYFTGDRNPRRTCPSSASEWEPYLTTQKSQLGIEGAGHPVFRRVHTLFLPAFRGVGRKGKA
jgi:hypothetical protein